MTISKPRTELAQLLVFAGWLKEKPSAELLAELPDDVVQRLIVLAQKQLKVLQVRRALRSLLAKKAGLKIT